LIVSSRSRYYSFTGRALTEPEEFQKQINSVCREIGERGRAAATAVDPPRHSPTTPSPAPWSPLVVGTPAGHAGQQQQTLPPPSLEIDRRPPHQSQPQPEPQPTAVRTPREPPPPPVPAPAPAPARDYAQHGGIDARMMLDHVGALHTELSLARIEEARLTAAAARELVGTAELLALETRLEIMSTGDGPADAVGGSVAPLFTEVERDTLDDIVAAFVLLRHSMLPTLITKDMVDTRSSPSDGPVAVRFHCARQVFEMVSVLITLR
jgi:hypothetical protein